MTSTEFLDRLCVPNYFNFLISAVIPYVYILRIIGKVFMLTSLYLVMPVGRITFRHAFVGGITATVLWEITRRVLVWYYSTLS